MRYRCGEARFPAELPSHPVTRREGVGSTAQKMTATRARHRGIRAPRMAPKAERVFDETRHRAPRALRTCACLEFALAGVWYKEFLTQLVMERINLALFAFCNDERTM